MSASASAAKPTLAQLAQLPRAPGKRSKKDSKIKLVAEGKRVFRDLVFFFFPNNDTNTARRMRITKALEYGGTWVVQWCEQVTHVVVDKGVEFGDLKSYLELDAMPRGVVVVNENWPADCISWRFLVDHKQPQYRVKGYVVVEEEKKDFGDDEKESGAQEAQSLQLKPVKKDFMVAQSTTPVESEESGSGDIQEPAGHGFEKDDDLDQGVEKATPGPYNDALEEIIAGTKHTEHLPFDIEDDSSPQTSDLEEDTDTEDERPKKAAKRSFGQHAGSSEQFQCMNKNDGKTKDTNPNARTIEILTEMGNYYEQTKDEWRSRAYRRAISTLRKQNHKITTKEEASQLPFVGARLAAKIEEIVWTDRLRRLENARLEPGDEALQTFLKIYGVGLSKASRWVMAGLRTLDDLTTHNVPLTPTQQVGLAHYSDFNSRIPRAEVTEHYTTVATALAAIDPAFTATVSGSYRRGAASSGDIDILISCPAAGLTRLQAVVFDELVQQLTRASFLKVALASHARGDDGRGTKWHGASALPRDDGPEVWRRIDLLLVPGAQLGAALIYFTGNDIFNRSIRLLASRKGMRLNQRGLYKDVMRGRGREKITEGELVEGRDERRIFAHLGVPWRPPEDRIC
ncbi:hypothetical protein SLS56_008731 [Neofusicoccum ribis]|uniref:DNA polymerase n=1 Tax=Neofusicoccum ribis TaxID=45134 RepID=A0ABR3SJA9_9PEZI